MPPREYIVVQGQFGFCMYFISRGVVQITVVKDDVEQALGYIPLQTATYCNMPLHAATHRYIPLHTATYRYIPLHTAT